MCNVAGCWHWPKDGCEFIDALKKRPSFVDRRQLFGSRHGARTKRRAPCNATEGTVELRSTWNGLLLVPPNWISCIFVLHIVASFTCSSLSLRIQDYESARVSIEPSLNYSINQHLYQCDCTLRRFSDRVNIVSISARFANTGRLQGTPAGSNTSRHSYTTLLETFHLH